MKELTSYKKQLEGIKNLIEKLEKGELTLAELSGLELLTRELHEKSIILRYKAFENKLSESELEDQSVVIEEEEMVFESEAEEPPSIDFSIFEETELVELIESDTDEKKEDLEEEDQSEIEGEIPESIHETEPIEVNENKESSFVDQFVVSHTSINSKFEGAKIDTLVGAFGLNQKLLYINELFDGSSELFSEAIKLLDSQSNLTEATEKLDKIATENSWDPEEETVIEFMTILKRRYA